MHEKRHRVSVSPPVPGEYSGILWNTSPTLLVYMLSTRYVIGIGAKYTSVDSISAFIRIPLNVFLLNQSQLH